MKKLDEILAEYQSLAETFSNMQGSALAEDPEVFAELRKLERALLQQSKELSELVAVMKRKSRKPDRPRPVLRLVKG